MDKERLPTGRYDNNNARTQLKGTYDDESLDTDEVKWTIEKLSDGIPYKGTYKNATQLWNV